MALSSEYVVCVLVPFGDGRSAEKSISSASRIRSAAGTDATTSLFIFLTEVERLLAQ